WKTDFASSAPSYLLGAVAAAVVIKVTESSGYWLTLLLTSAPLYLTYRMYRAGRESEARQGGVLETGEDATLTIISSSTTASSIRRPSRCSGTSGSTFSAAASSCCCRRKSGRRRYAPSASTWPRDADRWPDARSSCAGSAPTAPSSRSN